MDLENVYLCECIPVYIECNMDSLTWNGILLLCHGFIESSLSLFCIRLGKRYWFSHGSKQYWQAILHSKDYVPEMHCNVCLNHIHLKLILLSR